jgi:hypothetical protein
MGNDPTNNIHNLATWAVEAEQRDFRLTAVSDLREALKNYPDEADLVDAEIEYCEGWLYLARVEIGDVGDDKLDELLVEKVNRHLHPPDMAVLNG